LLLAGVGRQVYYTTRIEKHTADQVAVLLAHVSSPLDSIPGALFLDAAPDAFLLKLLPQSPLVISTGMADGFRAIADSLSGSVFWGAHVDIELVNEFLEATQTIYFAES
jgi:hypothetical protein